MYHPTTRLLTVLELLQSNPRLSGPELAERLEVDVRTVRRYIMMLQDLGIPIEGETGRAGGYTLRPGFKLPPLMFNEDEVVAITVGLLLARQAGIGGDTAGVAGALAKVERVLPDSLRGRAKAMQATLDSAPQEQQRTVDAAVLSALSLAVQEKRQVQFAYSSSSGASAERTVDPFGIAAHERRWYLAGYYHERGEARVFRLDRMRDVRLLTTTFTPPASFNALEFVLQRFSEIPDIWDIAVLLKTDLATAQRKISRPLAVLEQQANGVLLRSTFNDLDEFARILIGLGCPLVIISPPKLRDSFRELGRAALEIAEGV